jgi:hypothetical protein
MRHGVYIARMPAPSPGTLKLAALKAAGDPSYRDKIRAALVIQGSIWWGAVELEMDPRTLHRWIRADPTLAAGIKLRPRGNPDWVKGHKLGTAENA